LHAKDTVGRSVLCVSDLKRETGAIVAAARQPYVLVVDDDPALLQALSDTIALRFPDTVVDSCQSVQEALDRLPEHHYDVVITDLVMPGDSGLRLMEEMLRRHLTPAVMLITGHLNPAGYSHLGEAFTFLRKPIDRDDFTRSLRNAIRFGMARRRHAGAERRIELIEERAQQIEELRVAIADMKQKLVAEIQQRRSNS
jgi:DNA-binding NtrC family response regulator